MTVVSMIGHNRLDYARRRIIAGHDRASKGKEDWVEGSLEVAEALKEARDNMPADLAFSDWLKRHGLDALYDHNVRAALIKLASNPTLARTVLAESESRSYRVIWDQNKKRFTSPVKPLGRQRTWKKGRVMIYRTLKLGEETMAKIKGTSLDSAIELDELIVLNRGTQPGELTPQVAQLVADAAAGKDVSAVAIRGSYKIPPLVQAWRKRMIASWLKADKAQRQAFIEYLIDRLKEDSK
jgi:hypothetical protein